MYYTACMYSYTNHIGCAEIYPDIFEWSYEDWYE